MYRLFVDDTGTKEKEDAATDLFAYSGIILDSQKEQGVCASVAALKGRYFKTDSVELKSRWFRMPELRKEKYLSPYGLSDEAFKQFTSELFALISTSPIRCLGSVVSKAEMDKTYHKIVFDPSPVAYELLLQRVANFLTQYSIYQLGIVVDDMSGKNVKGSDWKELLVRQHGQLKLGKSPLYRTWKSRPGMDYSRMPKEIVFEDSSKSTPLQLADLCAYNVMRQARDFHTFDGAEMYPGYKWIYPIMHKDPKTKKVGGFGAVLFP